MQTVRLSIIEKPSLNLYRAIDLFRESTGLEIYTCFHNHSQNKCDVKFFSNTFHYPCICRLFHTTEKGRKQCEESHRGMMENTEKKSTPSYLRCFAGLFTFHVPFEFKGCGNGDLQTFGALSQNDETNERQFVIKKAKELGICNQQIYNALDDINKINKEKKRFIFQWLELIAGIITTEAENLPPENHLVHTKEDPFFFNLKNEIPLDMQIRKEIGEKTLIPSPKSMRSTGVSEKLILHIIEFVERNYDLPITSQIIALSLGFEPSYFGKTFKRFVNISFHHYLKQIRLDKAKLMLDNPFLSIKEIAERTGYSEVSYFTRVFRQFFGLTPSQHRKTRKIHKNTIHLQP